MWVRIRKWFPIGLALLAAAAIGAAVVFIAFDRAPVSDVQPPGCTLADKNLPGCRISHQRITNNTITLAAAIIGPLATLGVALAAVGSGRRRQQELVQAENDRQDARLHHERTIKAMELEAHERRVDLEHLRAFLDIATERVEDCLAASNRLRLAHESNDDNRAHLLSRGRLAVSNAQDAVDIAARQLDLRLEPDHPIRIAYWALIERLSNETKVLLALPDAVRDAENAGGEEQISAVRAFAVFGYASRVFYGATRDPKAQQIFRESVHDLLARHLDEPGSDDNGPGADTPPEAPTP